MCAHALMVMHALQCIGLTSIISFGPFPIVYMAIYGVSGDFEDKRGVGDRKSLTRTEPNFN